MWDSFTKNLQNEKTTEADILNLFNAFAADVFQGGARLASTGAIVLQPHIESGISKLQYGRILDLTEQKKQAVGV